MTTDMRYEPHERADADYTADTVGLTPGVAAVYMEHTADVFCPECARDMLGDELYSRVKRERVGYDHPKADEYGNVAAVLSTEEWDCPGPRCGHCAVPLDVRVIHYDAVCDPDSCPDMTVYVADGDGSVFEAAELRRDGEYREVMFRESNRHGDRGDTMMIHEEDLRHNPE